MASTPKFIAPSNCAHPLHSLWIALDKHTTIAASGQVIPKAHSPHTGPQQPYPHPYPRANPLIDNPFSNVPQPQALLIN